MVDFIEIKKPIEPVFLFPSTRSLPLSSFKHKIKEHDSLTISSLMDKLVVVIGLLNPFPNGLEELHISKIQSNILKNMLVASLPSKSSNAKSSRRKSRAFATEEEIV